MKNINYYGQKITVSDEVAEFLEQDRLRESAQRRSDQRHLDFVGNEIYTMPGLFTDEPTDPTFEQAFLLLRKHKLRKIFPTLPDDDQKLLRFYYFRFYTLEQIGKEYGADEVNIQVAEFDLETQVKQIENFINQEYDAIFILTSFTDAILPYVQQATDAGIPVIAMDGTLEGPPLVSHIVWDQAYTGKVLAEKAGDYIENELNGEARIVCLDSKSLEYMAVRQKAFLETLDERFGDKITIVNDSDCQTREEAMNTIVSISDSYDLVYAASDSNAHGAVAGMQSKGITGVPIYACGGFGEELYKAITDPDSPFFAVINIPGESIVSSAYEMLLKYLNGDTDIPEHVNCEVLYVDKNSPEDVLATLKP